MNFARIDILHAYLNLLLVGHSINTFANRVNPDETALVGGVSL